LAVQRRRKRRNMLKKAVIVSLLGSGAGAVAGVSWIYTKRVKSDTVSVVEQPKQEKSQPLLPGQPVFIPVETREEAKAVANAKEVGGDVEKMIEDRMLTTLRNDAAIQKIGDVMNVECRGLKCSVAVEAKNPEDSGVQMAVLKFVQAHPEYGTNFTIDESKDDPKVTLFTFSRSE
jgi:hypothetical protein